MSRIRISAAVISVIGMFVALGIAWGLDALMVYLGRRNAQTGALPYAILWARTLSFFLLAGVLVSLSWFVIERAPRNNWIGALYLLVGSFFGLFLLLYFIPAIGEWMPYFLYGPLLSATSYTMLAGSFIAVIGLSMLILPRR